MGHHGLRNFIHYGALLTSRFKQCSSCNSSSHIIVHILSPPCLLYCCIDTAVHESCKTFADHSITLLTNSKEGSIFFYQTVHNVFLLIKSRLFNETYTRNCSGACRHAPHMSHMLNLLCAQNLKEHKDDSNNNSKI